MQKGLKIQKITIYANAILLSPSPHNQMRSYRPSLREIHCLLAKKKNPLTFFKFFIFLSTSGSPDVTAGTVLRGALCDAEDCAGSWFASALASCR